MAYSDNPVVMPSLARFYAGLSQRRVGFNPKSLDVGFVLNKVAKRYVLNDFRTFPVLKVLYNIFQL